MIFQNRFAKLIACLTYLSAFSILNGCDHNAQYSKTVDEKRSGTQSNDIVVIICNKPVINNIYVFKSKMFLKTFEPEITYNDGSILSEEVSLYSKANDTLIIHPKKDFITLKTMLNALNYNEFVLQKGDTAVIKYQENYSNIFIKNKPKHRVFDLYNIKRKALFLANELTPMCEYFNSYMFIDWSKPNVDAQARLHKNNAYLNALFFIQRDNLLLDSLNRNGLLFPSEYSFYKKRNEYTIGLIQMGADKLSLSDVLEMTRNEKIGYNYLSNIYRKHFIEAAADKFIVAKATPMDFKDGINRDYRQSYFLIKNYTGLDTLDKARLLTREMSRIADTFSDDDFHKYYIRYTKDVLNTSITTSFKKNYELRINAKNIGNESLMLITSGGDQLSFEKLKETYIGKVIYVDFWASWCGPCREALPFSIKLREKLKARGVVFIYLSIDKTTKPWQIATNQEGLGNYKDSYIVANHLDSDFLKKQQVSSIPRYMIFDKKGKLAYTKAPSVESRELLPLLLKMSE